MPDPNWFWMGALGAVALYCIVQSIRDLRAKRYGWAAAISAALLLTMPVKTHAVKVDLPMSDIK